VKRRIYLTLERGRDLCLRNLLRKVCKDQKWEDDGKIRKVGLGEFVAAVGVSEGGGKVERDEVECLLANMIYKVCSIRPAFLLSSRFSVWPECWETSHKDALMLAPQAASTFRQHPQASFSPTPSNPPPRPPLPPRCSNLSSTLTILTPPLQNLMKGYISRDHGVVVLSKSGAFPGTGI